MTEPKFSIITVVWNGEQYLEQTILSVINQSYQNVEYIIIDGGSTDGTIDIIKKYEHKIAYWISEPDKGIYDAMNKGIDVAKGRYLLFLGADDFIFNDDVCLSIEQKIGGDLFDLIVGNIIYTNHIIVRSSFSKKLLLHNSIHHQGALYHRSLFENFRYDTTLKLISDYELNIILFLKRKYIKVLKLNVTISLCTENGASRRMLEVSKQETNRIRSKHMPLYKAKVFEVLYGLKFKIWNAIRRNKL